MSGALVLCAFSLLYSFFSDNLAEPSMAAGQPLVVCTAHIHWDPEYCDVKLIQTMMLMHELKSFVDEAATLFRLNAGGNKADSNSIPLIMCCDLNSLPDSGVVEYLSNGRIAVEHPDFKEIAYKDCLRKLSPIVSDSSKSNSNEYTHAFELIKAYKDDVMPFTNYTYVCVVFEVWFYFNSFRPLGMILKG